MRKPLKLASDDQQPIITDTEEQLSWRGGSALLRTQRANGSSHNNFFRNDLTINVILFQGPGSEVTWRVDGNLALDKTWASGSTPHDLIVLPPRCEFQSRSRGSSQRLWLFIDPEMLVNNEHVKSFAERATVNSSWSKDRLSWSVVSEIRKECTNGFPRGSMFLEKATTVFITQLAYVLTGTTPRLEPVRGLSDNKLQMIMDYFESNLHRNITLSEVSALVELTPRYFCEAFKQATGRPPHQFQIERRVERAKILLRDASLSLANVALMVGFSSQSHLSNYFHRITGVTPARYRADTCGKVAPVISAGFIAPLGSSAERA